MRNGQVGGCTGDVPDPRPVKAAHRASASGARSVGSQIAAARLAWTSLAMPELENWILFSCLSWHVLPRQPLLSARPSWIHLRSWADDFNGSFQSKGLICTVCHWLVKPLKLSIFPAIDAGPSEPFPSSSFAFLIWLKVASAHKLQILMEKFLQNSSSYEIWRVWYSGNVCMYMYLHFLKFDPKPDWLPSKCTCIEWKRASGDGVRTAVVGHLRSTGFCHQGTGHGSQVWYSLKGARWSDDLSLMDRPIDRLKVQLTNTCC